MEKNVEKTAADFEKKMGELRAIVTKLEQNATIEESIKLFESGLELSKACIDDLNNAKARIDALKDKLDLITATYSGADDE